jgi:hypothetical protein
MAADPDAEPVSPSKASADLLRLVRRVLTQATVDAPLAHEGEPCTGLRARCPNQPADEPYPELELLRSGRIVAFCLCHHGIHHPGDIGYAVLRGCFR